MAGILRDAGIEFVLPKGAFYFFAQGPRPGGRRRNSANCSWRSWFSRSRAGASACPAISA